MSITAKQYTDRCAITKAEHDRLAAEMGRPVTSETPKKRSVGQVAR
jgi:hypothetical protein